MLPALLSTLHKKKYMLTGEWVYWYHPKELKDQGKVKMRTLFIPIKYPKTQNAFYVPII